MFDFWNDEDDNTAVDDGGGWSLGGFFDGVLSLTSDAYQAKSDFESQKANNERLKLSYSQQMPVVAPVNNVNNYLLIGGVLVTLLVVYKVVK
jgi:hypothetical protein